MENSTAFNQVKIKIFGVGGGGCNAIDRLAQLAPSFPGIEFYACNTDNSALSNLKNKNNNITIIQLGAHQTNGYGAGQKPEVGKLATEESAQEIEEAIGDAQLVFISAGMGGGTGTGGAPIVAKIAKEKKALTIGVVTTPVSFEGFQKQQVAQEGIKELSKYVDVLSVVSNQQAFDICMKENQGTPLYKVFEKADEVLLNSIKGITDIIVNHTFINLDFNDITNVIKDKKTAHIGLGKATGENRMDKALKMACVNKLQNTTIAHCKDVIVNIIVDHSISAEEVQKALQLIPDLAPNAQIYNGFGFDDNLKDEVKVTIIATGLEQKSDANNIIEQKDEPSLFNTISKPQEPVQSEKPLDDKDSIFFSFIDKAKKETL